MTRRCPWKKRRPAYTPPPRTSSVVRGEHEFRIVGYTTAGSDHYSILSGAFHVGGHTWALECGFEKEGHLGSIFLELLTPYITQDLVVTRAGLRIEDPLGQCPAAEWHSEEVYTFTDGTSCWKLSVPDDFRCHESRYVQDDRLTILFTIEVLREDEYSTIADDVHKLISLSPEPESKSEYDRRRHTCMLPDLTFVVEDTEIQAHRLVLAMRSPVFAAELLGDMREGIMRRVRVDDIRASTFRAMIRFIYTDKLPIKAKAEDTASGSQQRASKEKCAARRRVAMACDLLAAADRYDLEKLRLMCEEILYESMDGASVMPTLLVANGRYSCRWLEASCIEYLASNADVCAAVKETDEYKDLEESCNSFVVEVMSKVSARRKLAVNPSLDTRHAKKKSVSTYDTSKVVKGTYEMRISNFISSVQMMRPGFSTRFDSNIFQVDGYDWKVVVYPYKNKANVERIGVCAELLTDAGTTGVRASVCLRINDPNGKSWPSTEEYSQLIFTRKVPYYGYNFTAMKYAEQHYLAHDGSLTIHCNIVVTNKSSIATSTPSAGGPPTIARHVKEMLASEKGSDVTFLLENREIRAHKLVIAARSPVLYKMVGADNKEEDRVTPINDMKAAAFEAMLHFIYTDELPPMEDIADLANSGAKEDDMSIAGEIMAAACRFRLNTMKAKFETLLAESISTENAWNMRRLARHHNLLKLEDYCDQFISSRYVANYRSRFALLSRVKLRN